jgi:threonyl-tRNA synthetase
MKYLIVNKKGESFEVDRFLKQEEHSESFNKFVRREALNEIIVPINDQHPEYLKYCSKFGFNWEENAGAGLVQYDYRANFIMRLVKDYARQLVGDIGFPLYEVQGSNMFDLDHPVVGAYANLYGERLFKAGSKGSQLVMSYDASYPQFNLAGKYQIGHKDLPFGHFSISDCYRYEQKGECMMFYRQRRFYMPDLHPYFKDINEAFEWYPQIEKQIINGASSANRKYEVVVEVSSVENWNNYSDKINKIAQDLGQDILIGIHEDNKDRYWIINADYKIIDKLGQAREIACIQIDVGNAERLDINYVDENDKKHHPVIIHSAVPGGIERYLYMIFDDFKSSMPLWLYPIQLRLIPVSDKFVPYCEELVQKYSGQVRIDIDDRSESVSKKIKESHSDLIPFSIVVGEKEVQGNNLAQFEESIEKILLEGKDKPFLKYNWPNLVSKQIK